MTFDERVHALEPFGFSERQTRFLVTVAPFSGFCLRRHYMAFAGLKYGAGVRDFLDRLVARTLARRFDFRADRGHVYHLCHSSIYDAIGQDDNRNRRHTSAALVARKLMLLDYVLSEPTGDWYATEDDKVAVFTTAFGVPMGHLPQRAYGPRHRPETHITRYFIHKLPIHVAVATTTVSLPFLVTDTSGADFEQFLWDHLRLLNRLPSWRLVVVVPSHIADVPACTAALRRVCMALQAPPPAGEIAQLRIYFNRRAALERGDDSFITGDINKISAEWHGARARFAGPLYQDFYARWKADGPSALEHRGGDPFLAALNDGRGQVVSHQLPIRYDRFGTRAGVV